MVIQWNAEKHSLGIPDIDKQHQELFLITNRLAEADALTDGPERGRTILASLKRLYAYCHFHFNTEEEILRSHHYEWFADHSDLHQGFTESVREFLGTFRERPNTELGPVLDELVRWIIDHIMAEDRRYADWFAAKGIPVEAHASHSGESSTAHDALKVWEQKQLSLEIKGIDDQHRELVMILAQTNDLLKTGRDRQRLYLPGIIQKLYYYSQFHFSFEEELMSRHLWDGLARHRELHRDFVRHLIDFTKAYNARSQVLTSEIVLYLKDWTVHHILEEDRAFKQALKEEPAS